MTRHRKLIIFLVLGIALAGTLVGGVVVLASGRANMPGGTTSAEAQPAAQATAPAAGARVNRAVVAKGALVPVQHATLSMAADGIVSEVLAKEGDRVTAGQVILRLQNQRQQAALAEADAGVASAQARLDIVKAGARDQEISAAQAALDAATARLARLQEASRPEDLAAVRANLNAAQAALQQLYKGPDKNTRIAASADLANAQAAVQNAQAAYDKVKSQPDIAMYPQSLQLEQATNALDAATAHYNELFAQPEADRVAQAAAQVKQAQASLDRLLNPATAAEIAEAAAGVRQAQAQLDLLKADARTEDIAAAQATVAQAQAARQQAAVSLADTELRAPFAGTLAAIDVRQGEQVSAGAPVTEIGDLSSWQVETDDLSELDIVRVQPGQTVALTFDAIPGLQLHGIVGRIQPKGEKKLGDMTYTAVIQMEDPDPRLLWNMTAVVNLP
jgi:HlyD family secretion protein